MKRVLVAVDLQNDFVDGALGTKEAQAIIPAAAEKIKSFDSDELFVTFDTHYADYSDTLEGKKLPVVHCVEGTVGHELNGEIKAALDGKEYTEIIKNTFGTFEISRRLKEKYGDEQVEITLIGLCTDICVASNAIILRAEYPNAVIYVDAACCAGVTPECHQAALQTLGSCQIDII